MKKILAVIICFAVMFSLNFVSAEKYVKVPNVVGAEYDEAKEVIEAAGLVVQTTYKRDSSKAVGVVLSQTPSSGKRVVGTTVNIVVNGNGLVNHPVDPNGGNDVITGVTGLTDKIWATAITIVQTLAIGCVVFAGVRYMYASADKKADIKKGMMYLAIGAIFVFATTTVMKFIYNAGSSLL